MDYGLFDRQHTPLLDDAATAQVQANKEMRDILVKLEKLTSAASPGECLTVILSGPKSCGKSRLMSALDYMLRSNFQTTTTQWQSFDQLRWDFLRALSRRRYVDEPLATSKIDVLFVLSVPVVDVELSAQDVFMTLMESAKSRAHIVVLEVRFMPNLHAPVAPRHDAVYLQQYLDFFRSAHHFAVG